MRIMRFFVVGLFGVLVTIKNAFSQVSFFIDTLSGFIPTEMCQLAPRGDTSRFVLVGIIPYKLDNGGFVYLPAACFYRVNDNVVKVNSMHLFAKRIIREDSIIDVIDEMNNNNFYIGKIGGIYAKWVACSRRSSNSVYVGWIEKRSIVAGWEGETNIEVWYQGGYITEENSYVRTGYKLPLANESIGCYTKPRGPCIINIYDYMIRSIDASSLQSKFLLLIDETLIYDGKFVSNIQKIGDVIQIDSDFVQVNFSNNIVVSSNFTSVRDDISNSTFGNQIGLLTDTSVLIFGSFQQYLSGTFQDSVLSKCSSNSCGFAYWSFGQSTGNGNFLFVAKSNTKKVGLTVSSVESISGNILRVWYNVKPLDSAIDSVWVYFKLLKGNRILIYDSIYSGVGSYSIDLNLSNFQADNIRKWAEGSIGPQFVHYWTDSLFAWGGNAVDSMKVDGQWQYEYSAYLFRESGLRSRKDLRVNLGVKLTNPGSSVVIISDTQKANPLKPVISLSSIFVGFSLRDLIESEGKIMALAYANSNNWYLTVNGDTIRQVQIDVPKEFWFAETRIPSSYAIVILDCPPIPSDSLFLREIQAGYEACEFKISLRNNSVYKTDTFLFRPDSLVLEVSFKDGCYWSDKFRVALWDTLSPTYNQFCGDLTVSVPVSTEGVELWTSSGQVSFIDTTVDVYQLPDTGTYWLRVYDTVGCYIGWSDTFYVWKVGIDSFLLGYEEFCGTVELFGLSDFNVPYYVYRDSVLYGFDTSSVLVVDSSGLYFVVLLDSGTCRYAYTDTIAVRYKGIDSFEIPLSVDCETLVLPDSLSYEQWYVHRDSTFIGIYSGNVISATQSGVYYIWAIDSGSCRYYHSGGSFVEMGRYDTLLLPVSYQCGNLWVSGGDTLSGRYYLVYEGDTIYVSDSSSFWIDSAGLYWIVYVDTTGCIVGYSDSVFVRRSNVSYPLTIRYSDGVLYVEGVKDVANVVLYSASGSIGTVPVLLRESEGCALCPEKPTHEYKVSELVPGIYVAEVITKNGNRFYRKVLVR